MTPLPTLALLLLALAADSPPIGPHPENPRYFLFRGEPAILVGSGEHYGAVLNLDFDFGPYLDELAARGLNQTRTFSGTYREVPGSFEIESNTLAPAKGRYLGPWPIVSAPGEPEKFDLSRFEPAYFERLKTFVREAGRRGVVVELVLFCTLYNDDLWAVSPMNPANTVQGGPPIDRTEVHTLKHPALLDRQLAFVREVVAALAEFDNVYFEICNEPYFQGVTLDWQARVAAEIVAAEQDRPAKHMIAQNINNKQQKIERPDPAVSLFNFHYADPPAVLENLGLNKAIGDDETGFEGNDDRPYREEAWLFLLSGGAEFSHLDYSFTVDHEDGTARVKAPTPGGGGPALREQFALLKRTIEGLDFLRLEPTPRLFAEGLPEGVKSACLSQEGKQYAAYFSRSNLAPAAEIPAGTYQIRWLDPRAAREVMSGRISHDGGKLTLQVPAGLEADVAVCLVREAD